MFNFAALELGKKIKVSFSFTEGNGQTMLKVHLDRVEKMLIVPCKEDNSRYVMPSATSIFSCFNLQATCNII